MCLHLQSHGHALNLPAGDANKSSKHAKDALNIASEESKLLKFSPKKANLRGTCSGRLLCVVPYSLDSLCGFAEVTHFLWGAKWDKMPYFLVHSLLLCLGSYLYIGTPKYK